MSKLVFVCSADEDLKCRLEKLPISSECQQDIGGDNSMSLLSFTPGQFNLTIDDQLVNIDFLIVLRVIHIIFIIRPAADL